MPRSTSDTAQLPAPAPDALAHSARLHAVVANEIAQAGGCIPFRRFMELALYAPGLGYYSAGAHKFGGAGDFVTAPELGSLFARCLARQCQQVMAQAGANILECGAGTGALAAELLREWARLDCLPERYAILEVSADLRARQEQTLRERVPDLLARVAWLNELPAHGFCGVILGNELLDAMPVDIFVRRDGMTYERMVADDGGQLVYRDEPLTSEPLLQRVTELQRDLGASIFGDHYFSEVNFAAEGWLTSAARGLERGAIVLADYGFPAREYYHPDRSGGTLMCHYRHRAHPDPLRLLGLQDITAHVDFTAMAQAAHDAGCDVLGYTNQAQFLLNCGLLDMVAAADATDARAYLALTSEVKRLTLPSEMGELFKVLVVGKGIDDALLGFVSGDRRHRL